MADKPEEQAEQQHTDEQQVEDQLNDEQEVQQDGGEDAVSDDPIVQLQQQVEELSAQVAEGKDQVLRAHAESQNIRRRSEKDVENAHKFALEKFCNALLPVVDNLERAQQVEDPNNEVVKPLLEGVELTHKSFIEVLNKFSLELVDPVGEPFDPQLHQAITSIESPDAEPNTVLDVMQKGYTLNGRLIRPAMVVVSKA